MPGYLFCATSDNLPDWVLAQAEDIGVRLQPLESTTRGVSSQLARLQPDGYLMNGPPDYGPYFDAELAHASPCLKLVTYFGQSLEPAEYDTFLDASALASLGISVTTTPGASDSVAEGTIALLLALNLGLVSHNKARKEGQDPGVNTRPGVYGSRLGIVGMGQIGTRVAEIAHCLGMDILYTSRTRKQEIERRLDAGFADLPTLFSECQHVSIHTPGSVTEGLIDDEILAHARGIDLINTTSIARIVEPHALLDALDDGRIARAAIEGRYAEPYDSRLRTFGDERVLLLPPYTSWDTERSWQAGWVSYLETLNAFVSGAPLPYQLNTR